MFLLLERCPPVFALTLTPCYRLSTALYPDILIIYLGFNTLCPSFCLWSPPANINLHLPPFCLCQSSKDILCSNVLLITAGLKQPVWVIATLLWTNLSFVNQENMSWHVKEEAQWYKKIKTTCSSWKIENRTMYKLHCLCWKNINYFAKIKLASLSFVL